MENNKDVRWYLDMNCDAFSFSMDTADVGIVLLPLTGIVLSISMVRAAAQFT